MNDEGTRTPESPGANGRVKKVRGVVYLDPSRCKGCGFCIAFCPPHVLEFSTEFNPQGYHPPRLKCAGAAWQKECAAARQTRSCGPHPRDSRLPFATWAAPESGSHRVQGNRSPSRERLGQQDCDAESKAHNTARCRNGCLTAQAGCLVPTYCNGTHGI